MWLGQWCTDSVKDSKLSASCKIAVKAVAPCDRLSSSFQHVLSSKKLKLYLGIVPHCVIENVYIGKGGLGWLLFLC